MIWLLAAGIKGRESGLKSPLLLKLIFDCKKCALNYQQIGNSSMFMNYYEVI